MSTWVPISRTELEDWIETLPLKGKGHLQPGKAGVYLLPLSESVAVKLSSTIGSSDDAMGRGEASMQLSLISLVTGKVLNKKAQGQTRFHRTTNWRKTWKAGFDRMADAYLKSQGFYDAIAEITDRDKWQQDVLTAIESVTGWQEHPILSDFHRRVKEGGILTIPQQNLLEKLLDKLQKLPVKPPQPTADAELLVRLRTLWTKAKDMGNSWLVDFVGNVGPQVKAGRPLSPRQKEVLEENFKRFGI
jgi:hypothetical protein